MNGFFVAAEFAMVKVRSTRIQQLVDEGNRRARSAQLVINHLDAHLSATQLGITLASLGLGWLGEPAVARLLEGPLGALGAPGWAIHGTAFVIAFMLITVAHIVAGELAPKSLAILQPESVALWTSAPLRLFYRIFYPLIWLLNGMSFALLRLFGISTSVAHEAAHTDEELRMLVSASAQGGYLDETERALLDNVIDFSDRIAREIMVPRGEMVCLYVEDLMDENMKVAKTEGHTRFPLAQEDKDHILGLVHIKDLFARAEDLTDLRDVMRPMLMVPDTISISTLLKEFQRQRAQMAILVDEYGGTAGLVTVEDVLEEIVGEIQDEFDPEEEPEVETISPNVYEVDGAMLLEDAQEQFGFRMEDEPDVDTLGGYLFTVLGRQPEVGDVVPLPGYVAEVVETEGFRISRVRLTRPQDDEGSSGDGQEDPAVRTAARVKEA